MKMNKLQTVSFCCLSLVLVFAACTKDAPIKGLAIPQLPGTPYDYVDDLPSHMDNIFWPNPVNIDERATLGRVLFHDTRLSVSNNISCGSCHLPSKGYADGKQFSEGWRHELTTRNAQSIVNPGTQSIFFWDARSFDLNEQVFMPITNHIEMGINNLDDIVAKVNALDYYPFLFEDAFDSPEADLEKIQIALSTYVRSMVSYRSKWDEGFAQNFGNFTSLELEGKALFESKYQCNNCHSGSNFSGWGGDLANIGLDPQDELVDIGAGATWGEFMNGSFKVPSLRNVMTSAPYMHDGRFATIDEVIDHYDHGVIDSPMLDYRLRDFGVDFIDDIFFIDNSFSEFPPRQLNTTTHERDALKAFLHTLTDPSYLNDERYSNPFVMP